MQFGLDCVYTLNVYLLIFFIRLTKRKIISDSMSSKEIKVIRNLLKML